MPKKAAVLWTGGKDCAQAMQEAIDAGHEIRELITFAPPNPAFLAHPIPFLKRQAEAIGIGHRIITIVDPLAESYSKALFSLRREGIETLVTGDIAEIDGRPNWMGEVAKGTGMDLFMPLWNRDRRSVLTGLWDRGFEAIFSLVKKPWFTKEWVGRSIDRRAAADMAEMSPSPDLCGENGEYHSLVLNGPIFKQRLAPPDYAVREMKGMMFYGFAG